MTERQPAGDSLALSRLMQLASPMLPIGAYGYSQGFETAIEDGIVTDAATTRIWIDDCFRLGVSRFDLPILWRLRTAWDAGDRDEAAAWNDRLLAGRDTAEFRAETLQTGHSLSRLLVELRVAPAGEISGTRVTLPLAYAVAASYWAIDRQMMLHAFAWSWAENQVSVAMKTVPIGQVAGQKILLDFGRDLAQALPGIAALADDDIVNFTPGLSIFSCRHERQYSRLFRS